MIYEKLSEYLKAVEFCLVTISTLVFFQALAQSVAEQLGDPTVAAPPPPFLSVARVPTWPPLPTHTAETIASSQFKFAECRARTDNVHPKKRVR